MGIHRFLSGTFGILRLRGLFGGFCCPLPGTVKGLARAVRGDSLFFVRDPWGLFGGFFFFFFYPGFLRKLPLVFCPVVVCLLIYTRDFL